MCSDLRDLSRSSASQVSSASSFAWCRPRFELCILALLASARPPASGIAPPAQCVCRPAPCASAGPDALPFTGCCRIQACVHLVQSVPDWALLRGGQHRAWPRSHHTRLNHSATDGSLAVCGCLLVPLPATPQNWQSLLERAFATCVPPVLGGLPGGPSACALIVPSPLSGIQTFLSLPCLFLSPGLGNWERHCPSRKCTSLLSSLGLFRQK